MTRAVLVVLVLLLGMGSAGMGSAGTLSAGTGSAGKLSAGPTVHAGTAFRSASVGPSSAGTRAAGPTGRPATALPPAGVLYRAPIRGRLVFVRAFLAPPGPYAAGHRGVDLATHVGEPVLAAGAGTVRFAATVAGRGVVVVAHADGVRTEYEPVLAGVAVGTAVVAGRQIGWVQGAHGDCPTGRCLHWGATRAGMYFDPLVLLRPLAPVRLLPWPGN